MRNTSSAFRRALYDGNRNYQCTVNITLVDNTELTITNVRVAENGVLLDDNVSDTSSFTALGSVIINSLTLQINNVYEEYSEYDFTGADVVLYIALPGVQESPIKICTMTVEKATYNGMIITLNCLDNMVNFDIPYTSTLIYPATLQSIVFDACTECGVVLGTTTFPNYTFEVPIRPNDEALTYREVISYVATLAGCFARCNSNGLLELKWFDKNALIAIENVINGGIFDEDSPYSTGDTVNGGIFNPWNTGDVVDGGAFTDRINAHYITALSSQELGMDNVVITGIQITVENEVEIEEETRTDIITRTYGTSDYVIKIENNPFITLTNMDTIGAFLQNQLAGLTFRYGTVTHLNDPAIEAGDVAMVWDRKGNAYPLLVTNTQFEVGNYQTTTCSADTPVKNSATRFSALTKSFVQNKEVVRKESNALETRFNQAINAKAGMYETSVQEAGGGYTYYMHDRPNLSDSSAVIKITNEAVAVTPNYQASPVQWYGLTVDGTFIANIMDTIGINFDWGTGGTLTLGGQNNQNGILTVLDTNSNIIGVWNNLGIRLYNADGSLTGQFAYGTNFETQIGKTDTSHIYMDYHSMQLVDKEGTTYFYISDLRGLDGKFALTESLIVDDDSETAYHVALLPVEVTVTVNGTVVTNYTRDGRDFHFSAPFTIGDTVVFDYTTESQYAKGYTFGLRESGHAIGSLSIIEGYLGYASGFAAHAEGYKTGAQGDSAHAEGNNTIARGHRSHAEGYNTQTTINSYGAHAEGGYTIASANYAHSEGWHTTASDKNAHAEGYYTTASGFASHVGGKNSVTSKNSSFAHGLYLLASSNYQTVFGKYNIEDSNDTYAFIVGNGTSDSARSNAMTVDWSGNVKANDFIGNSTIGTVSNADKTMITPATGANYSNYDDSFYIRKGNLCWLHLGLKNVPTSGIQTIVASLPDAYAPLYPLVAVGIGGSGYDVYAWAMINTNSISVHTRDGWARIDAVYMCKNSI